MIISAVMVDVRDLKIDNIVGLTVCVNFRKAEYFKCRPYCFTHYYTIPTGYSANCSILSRLSVPKQKSLSDASCYIA